MALLKRQIVRPASRQKAWRGFALIIAAAAYSLPLPASSADGMIYDQVTGCGTSNPFPAEGETIRWNGACLNGMLSGFGTLAWYQNGAETQRNEGMFWGGEMHGPTTTTYPDGTRIIGTYDVGRRSGQFMTFRADGSHTVSVFNNGTLVSERAVPAQAPMAALRPMSSERPVSSSRPMSSGQAVVRPVYRGARATEARPFSARQQPAAPAFGGDGAFGTAFRTMIISSSGISTGDAASVQRTPQRIASAGRPDTPRRTIRNTQPAQQPQVQPQPTRLALATQRPATTRLIPRSAPQYGAPAAQYRAPVQSAYVRPAPQGARVLTPEQRFVQAFTAERAGQTQQAVNTYSQISAQYPHTQSASLANERLAMLTAAAPSVAKANPATAAPAFQKAAMNGRFVCTLPGLFDGNSKWCGIVRNANEAYLSVEVKQVKADGFFNIGFTRAPCTGNTFINYFSRGIRVSVPRNCMGQVW